MDNSRKENVQILLPNNLNQILENTSQVSGKSKSEVVVAKILNALEQENQLSTFAKFLCWLKTEKVSVE